MWRRTWAGCLGRKLGVLAPGVAEVEHIQQAPGVGVAFRDDDQVRSPPLDKRGPVAFGYASRPARRQGHRSWPSVLILFALAARAALADAAFAAPRGSCGVASTGWAGAFFPLPCGKFICKHGASTFKFAAGDVVKRDAVQSGHGASDHQVHARAFAVNLNQLTGPIPPGRCHSMCARWQSSAAARSRYSSSLAVPLQASHCTP